MKKVVLIFPLNLSFYNCFITLKGNEVMRVVNKDKDACKV